MEMDALARGEVRTNPRGGKFAAVTLKSGLPVVVTATTPLPCPFGAGIFQGDGTETRLNVDFGQLEGLEAIFRGLDEQLVQAACAAKESLWPGNNLSDQQVRENYTSPLKEREGYSATLRCKLDTQKVRCWSWEGVKVPLPDSKAKGCQVCPASSSSPSGSCLPNGEPRSW